MTDSEGDLLSNDAYNYRSSVKSIYVKGPNSGFYNLNNFLSSTRNMMQQSEYYGSSASNVSMRSLDSNVSVADIVIAIKNANFNHNEIRLIKQTINNYLKDQTRSRVEKRLNRKLFSKNTRLQYGEDSGDHGSDSSLSSDDCRSTRTASYKDNFSIYKANKDRTMNPQATIKENSIYNDCTEKFRQCHTRNMLSINSIHSSVVVNRKSAVLQKDRFDKRCPYAAKRFNKCPQSPTEPKSINMQMMNNICCDSESQQEEIFSETSTTGRNRGNSKPSHKRLNDLNEMPKTRLQNGLDRKSDRDNFCNNNFVFAKPQLPVKRTCKENGKTSNPKILISNCQKPLSDVSKLSDSTVTQKESLSSHTLIKIMENHDGLGKRTVNNNESVKENQPNDDLSMRPSFIKRKLFTQKLDIAENRNLCNTSQNNSPHIKKSANNNIKEKNKTRKITSSQSCLSRDVLIEENQIKDLIQKIVPSDGMSNATNHSPERYSNSPLNDSDKWDVTSVISTCNKNEFSDTYTDEEIFNPVEAANKCNKNTNKVQSNLNANCCIMLKKLPQNLMFTTEANNSTMEQNVINGVRKVDLKKKPSLQQKSFWETDLESDFDNNDSLPRNLNGKKINRVVVDKVEEERAGSTNIINNNKKTDKAEVNLNTTQSRPKRTLTMKTTQANIEAANSKIPEKRSKTSKRRKMDTPDSNQNTSKSSNRNLKSSHCITNLDNDVKSFENFNTVSLINHKVLRSKRLANKKLHNNSTPCQMKCLDVSNDFNISIKSLRSWNNKTNE